MVLMMQQLTFGGKRLVAVTRERTGKGFVIIMNKEYNFVVATL